MSRLCGALGLAGGLYVWKPASGGELTTSEATAVAGATRAVATMEALVSVGIWDGFDLSAGVSAHQGPFGEGGADSRVLGDVRVVPRLRLSGGDDGGLALVLPVSIPAGRGAPRARDGVALEPRLAAHYGGESFVITVNAGYLTRPVAPEASPASTDAVTGTVGAAVRLFESWSVLAEVAGRAPLPRLGDTRPYAASAEWRGGVRYSFTQWAAQLAAGRGIPGVEGEAAWQVLANVSFALGAPEDHDADSSQVDRIDELRDAAWRIGPADLPGSAPRGDARAGLDASGRDAPCTAGQQADDGLGCVEIPESSDSGGGAPVAEIREIIGFETNDSHIDPKYNPVLDALAERLKAVPDVRIIIEGHSDSSGPPRFNRELSRMRASTVRYHLFQRGVAWRRMWLAPHGASRPLTDEKDEAGRARNRRVEVRMLRAP